MEEQATVNRKVVGSTPTPGALEIVMARRTVVERLLSGWKHPEGANMAFNDALAEWHGDKKFAGTVYEYMGLTKEEYGRWVMSAAAAEKIVEERKMVS